MDLEDVQSTRSTIAVEFFYFPTGNNVLKRSEYVLKWEELIKCQRGEFSE